MAAESTRYSTWQPAVQGAQRCQGAVRVLFAQCTQRHMLPSCMRVAIPRLQLKHPIHQTPSKAHDANARLQMHICAAGHEPGSHRCMQSTESAFHNDTVSFHKDVHKCPFTAHTHNDVLTCPSTTRVSRFTSRSGGMASLSSACPDPDPGTMAAATARLTTSASPAA